MRVAGITIKACRSYAARSVGAASLPYADAYGYKDAGATRLPLPLKAKVIPSAARNLSMPLPFCPGLLRFARKDDAGSVIASKK
ncbi:hypothetical protein FACS1894181_12180 [Bacteroidia bacterium]|nr:hypothetical protein FACS1894181_12180 [Bacteroidia bacterium]